MNENSKLEVHNSIGGKNKHRTEMTQKKYIAGTVKELSNF